MTMVTLAAVLFEERKKERKTSIQNEVSKSFSVFACSLYSNFLFTSIKIVPKLPHYNIQRH